METVMNINSRQLAIVTENTAEGGTITVTTERGKWSKTPFTNVDGVKTLDDVARMLFVALAAPGEAEENGDFEKWCAYMDAMGDLESDRVREEFDQWKQQAAAWSDSCGLTVGATLEYLVSHYDI